jgi:hypothetical protein
MQGQGHLAAAVRLQPRTLLQKFQGGLLRVGVAVWLLRSGFDDGRSGEAAGAPQPNPTGSLPKPNPTGQLPKPSGTDGEESEDDESGEDDEPEDDEEEDDEEEDDDGRHGNGRGSTTTSTADWSGADGGPGAGRPTAIPASGSLRSGQLFPATSRSPVDTNQPPDEGAGQPGQVSYAGHVRVPCGFWVVLLVGTVFVLRRRV